MKSAAGKDISVQKRKFKETKDLELQRKSSRGNVNQRKLKSVSSKAGVTMQISKDNKSVGIAPVRKISKKWQCISKKKPEKQLSSHYHWEDFHKRKDTKLVSFMQKRKTKKLSLSYVTRCCGKLAGWVRIVTQRQQGESSGTWDAMYLSPDNCKLRSRPDAEKYILSNRSKQLKVDMFCFDTKALRFEETDKKDCTFVSSPIEYAQSSLRIDFGRADTNTDLEARISVSGNEAGHLISEKNVLLNSIQRKCSEMKEDVTRRSTKNMFVHCQDRPIDEDDTNATKKKRGKCYHGIKRKIALIAEERSEPGAFVERKTEGINTRLHVHRLSSVGENKTEQTSTSVPHATQKMAKNRRIKSTEPKCCAKSNFRRKLRQVTSLISNSDQKTIEASRGQECTSINQAVVDSATKREAVEVLVSERPIIENHHTLDDPSTFYEQSKTTMFEEVGCPKNGRDSMLFVKPEYDCAQTIDSCTAITDTNATKMNQVEAGVNSDCSPKIPTSLTDDKHEFQRCASSLCAKRDELPCSGADVKNWACPIDKALQYGSASVSEEEIGKNPGSKDFKEMSPPVTSKTSENNDDSLILKHLSQHPVSKCPEQSSIADHSKRLRQASDSSVQPPISCMTGNGPTGCSDVVSDFRRKVRKLAPVKANPEQRKSAVTRYRKCTSIYKRSVDSSVAVKEKDKIEDIGPDDGCKVDVSRFRKCKSIYKRSEDASVIVHKKDKLENICSDNSYQLNASSSFSKQLQKTETKEVVCPKDVEDCNAFVCSKEDCRQTEESINRAESEHTLTVSQGECIERIAVDQDVDSCLETGDVSKADCSFENANDVNSSSVLISQACSFNVHDAKIPIPRKISNDLPNSSAPMLEEMSVKSNCMPKLEEESPLVTGFVDESVPGISVDVLVSSEKNSTLPCSILATDSKCVSKEISDGVVVDNERESRSVNKMDVSACSQRNILALETAEGAASIADLLGYDLRTAVRDWQKKNESDKGYKLKGKGSLELENASRIKSFVMPLRNDDDNLNKEPFESPCIDESMPVKTEISKNNSSEKTNETSSVSTAGSQKFLESNSSKDCHTDLQQRLTAISQILENSDSSPCRRVRSEIGKVIESLLSLGGSELYSLSENISNCGRVEEVNKNVEGKDQNPSNDTKTDAFQNKIEESEFTESDGAYSKLVESKAVQTEPFDKVHTCVALFEPKHGQDVNDKINDTISSSSAASLSTVTSEKPITVNEHVDSHTRQRPDVLGMVALSETVSEIGNEPTETESSKHCLDREKQVKACSEGSHVVQGNDDINNDDSPCRVNTELVRTKRKIKVSEKVLNFFNRRKRRRDSGSGIGEKGEVEKFIQSRKGKVHESEDQNGFDCQNETKLLQLENTNDNSVESFNNGKSQEVTKPIKLSSERSLNVASVDKIEIENERCPSPRNRDQTTEEYNEMRLSLLRKPKVLELTARDVESSSTGEENSEKRKCLKKEKLVASSPTEHSTSRSSSQEIKRSSDINESTFGREIDKRTSRKANAGPSNLSKESPGIIQNITMKANVFENGNVRKSARLLIKNGFRSMEGRDNAKCDATKTESKSDEKEHKCSFRCLNDGSCPRLDKGESLKLSRRWSSDDLDKYAGVTSPYFKQRYQGQRYNPRCKKNIFAREYSNDSKSKPKGNANSNDITAEACRLDHSYVLVGGHSNREGEYAESRYMSGPSVEYDSYAHTWKALHYCKGDIQNKERLPHRIGSASDLRLKPCAKCGTQYVLRSTSRVPDRRDFCKQCIRRKYVSFQDYTQPSFLKSNRRNDRQEKAEPVLVNYELQTRQQLFLSIVGLYQGDYTGHTSGVDAPAVDDRRSVLESTLPLSGNNGILPEEKQDSMSVIVCNPDAREKEESRRFSFHKGRIPNIHYRRMGVKRDPSDVSINNKRLKSKYFETCIRNRRSVRIAKQGGMKSCTGVRSKVGNKTAFCGDAKSKSKHLLRKYLKVKRLEKPAVQNMKNSNLIKKGEFCSSRNLQEKKSPSYGNLRDAQLDRPSSSQKFAAKNRNKKIPSCKGGESKNTAKDTHQCSKSSGVKEKSNRCGKHTETIYKPPKSPYNLIQEVLYENPWKLLVATIFLNKTSGKLAIQVMWKFFELWPDPETTMYADWKEIAGNCAFFIETCFASRLRSLASFTNSIPCCLANTELVEILTWKC